MALRDVLQRRIHGLVGFGTGEVDLDRPFGDAGLFGPGSATWKVHGDFTAMMVGGVGALLLQMLHPGALAGVWDHSNWREDTLGRLRRTAQFIAGTTYGSTATAEAMIARIRRVHDRVHGMRADGISYSASDPALLAWVQAAEGAMFLEAYLRYCDLQFAVGAQDRYLAEGLIVAERLGAAGVPGSRRAMADYLDHIRPELRYDGRTREVAAALFAQHSTDAITGPFRRIFLDAGAELLPPWAARMHGIDFGPARRRAIRAAVRGTGSVLRWALRDGARARAERRAG